MGLGFFRRRKTEELTLEEAEARVLSIMRSAEADVNPFMLEKEKELRAEISSLISSLEGFDVNAVHPRLRDQARNFVSAMLTLWRDELGKDAFHEASRRLEKTASMNVRYFRMLFAVGSPEIERVDAHLRAIAGTIADVEGKRREAGIDDLENTLRMIEKTRDLIEERVRVSRELAELLSEIEQIEGERSGEGDDERLAALKAEVEAVEQEVARREEEVHRKIARVKKPIRLYAHAVGVKISTETRSLLLSMDDLKNLASGALSEVRKGTIKLKEKRQDVVLKLLEEIVDGSLESEIERIGQLKRRLGALKSELRKLESRRERHDPAERRKVLERRMVSLQETVSRLDGEIGELRRELENALSGLMGLKVTLAMDGV
ncbi:hypothetical protein [Geoglobus ahangari]